MSPFDVQFTRVYHADQVASASSYSSSLRVSPKPPYLASQPPSASPPHWLDDAPSFDDPLPCTKY